MRYFRNIAIAYKTLKQGLKLTFGHLLKATRQREPLGVADDNYFDRQNGLFTTQYPFESIPVPDNGRYRLHNEIDDCIVCDKCAKICPVNCIDIEPIRATEEIGKTSDGTSKRIYAAKFDIDMAKCCFCGLCTTVCPTECLTMTKAYDFSEFDVKHHNYAFSEMTPSEILEKRQELDAFNRKKEEKKQLVTKSANEPDETTKAKPKFVPKIKAKTTSKDETAGNRLVAKPKFRPKLKPPVSETADESKTEAQDTERPKAKFRPKIKPKTQTEPKGEQGHSEQEKPAKPKFKPKVKPLISGKSDESKAQTQDAEKSTAKFRPKVKPKIQTEPKDEQNQSKQEKPVRPRPVIKKKRN